MSVRTLSVPAGSTPPVLEVRNFAGSVLIDAVEGADAVDVRVEALDSAAEQLLESIELTAGPAGPGDSTSVRVVVPNRVLWRTPAFAITVRTPAGTRASVAAAAANIEVRGRTGRLDLTVASGDVTVGDCDELQVRSAVGPNRLGGELDALEQLLGGGVEGLDADVDRVGALHRVDHDRAREVADLEDRRRAAGGDGEGADGHGGLQGGGGG